MKLPSGIIIFFQSNPKSTKVILENKELILCKDCKYGKPEEDEEYLLCEYDGGSWYPPNHYCSYAERKEEWQNTKNGINTACYANMLTCGKKTRTPSIVQHLETIVLIKLHMILKRKRKMKIGDEIYVHGYVDEIRKDCIIIRNDGGYFGTVKSEIVEAQKVEDTVPVIRCKDCLYWKNYCRVVDGVASYHVCSRKQELDGFMHRSKANDFCSWAKRKEK